MTAPTVIPVDPFLDRQGWLAARRHGIGASDAPAVVGLSPWESPFSLWLEKTGKGLDADEPTEAMEWGTLLEPIVRHYFTQRTGLMVARPAGILVHPDHPWMLASLDGIVVDGNGEEIGGYEGKTASAWKSRDWDVDDGQVPEHVIVQCQHQMAVTGFPIVHVAVLVGGQQFRAATVERDEQLIGDLIAVEEKFWVEHVLADTPPPVDGHAATTDAIKSLWPDSTPDLEVDLPVDANRLIGDYRDADRRVKAAEADKDEAANQLRALLGDAEIGRIDGMRAVTWKSQTSTALDRKALRDAHPDLCEQFSHTTTTRVLRLVKGYQP